MQLLIKKGFLQDGLHEINWSRDSAYTRAVVAKNLNATRDEECDMPLSQYNLNYVFQPIEPIESTANSEGDDTGFPQEGNLALPLRTQIDAPSTWILDQGVYGSCVVNAIVYAIRLVRRTNSLQDFQPSRFFIYYFARMLEGRSLTQDTGVYIATACKALALHSVCSEDTWAYDNKKIHSHPTDYAISAAMNHERMGYMNIAHGQSTCKSLQTLILHGYPVLFGFTVFASFMSTTTAKTGQVSTPPATSEIHTDEGEQNGGHAAVLIGYDDHQGAFIFANSFSRKWGKEGTGYLPYEYALNPKYVRDFHVLYMLKGQNPPAELLLSRCNEHQLLDQKCQESASRIESKESDGGD